MEPFGASVTTMLLVSRLKREREERRTYHCIIMFPSGEMELHTQRVAPELPRLSASVLGVARSGSVTVVGEPLNPGN